MGKAKKARAKASKDKAGTASPESAGTPRYESDSMPTPGHQSPPIFSHKKSVPTFNFAYQPAVNIQSVCPERFYNLEIQIGGSTNDVVLSHWRGLKDTEKAELMVTTKKDVFTALNEMGLTRLYRLVGEPSEECAQEVAKGFLYAMEACDGRYAFPEMASIEHVGLMEALVANLMLHFEEQVMLNHTTLTWLFLLWHHKMFPGFVRVLFFILTPILCFGGGRYIGAARQALRTFLVGGIMGRRRWHPYVRWRQNLFHLTCLSLILAQNSMRWYIVTLAVAAAAHAADYFLTRQTAAEDESGVLLVRGLLLWALKLLLLLQSWAHYVSLLLVCGMYFPTPSLFTLTCVYGLVGVVVEHCQATLPSLLPLPWRLRFASFYVRRPRNRVLVLLLFSLLIPAANFYVTSGWRWRLPRALVRWLSIFAAANLWTIQDLEKGLLLLQSLVMAVLTAVGACLMCCWGWVTRRRAKGEASTP